MNYFWINNKVVRFWGSSVLNIYCSVRQYSITISEPVLSSVGRYLVIAELWLLFEDMSFFTSGSGFGPVGEGVSMSGGCTGFGVVVMSVGGV